MKRTSIVLLWLIILTSIVDPVNHNFTDYSPNNPVTYRENTDQKVVGMAYGEPDAPNLDFSNMGCIGFCPEEFTVGDWLLIITIIIVILVVVNKIRKFTKKLLREEFEKRNQEKEGSEREDDEMKERRDAYLLKLAGIRQNNLLNKITSSLKEELVAFCVYVSLLTVLVFIVVSIL
tara:strand:+ start:56 stop:583 length:528 start_codon:yes stop_codon:yes gene_type:complete